MGFGGAGAALKVGRGPCALGFGMDGELWRDQWGGAPRALGLGSLVGLVRPQRVPSTSLSPGWQVGRGPCAMGCWDGWKTHSAWRKGWGDAPRALSLGSLVGLVRPMQGPQHLVVPSVAGGELFERIVDDDFEHTEPSSAQYVQQILEGLHFMHGQAIVHLDLKPENIVCVSPGSHWIKIIDFGLARKLGELLEVQGRDCPCHCHRSWPGTPKQGPS